MYAEACFETFRVIQNKVFGWQAHMERLKKGLSSFGVALPDRLKDICLDAAADVGSDALVRLTVSGGPARWGLRPPELRQPGIYVQAIPYQAQPSPVAMCSLNWPFPLRSKVAKYTSDYAETLRALQLMSSRGLEAGVEALVCDNQRLYSGVTANVLVYREERWWTPGPVSILPGIIRDNLIQAGVVVEVDCLRTLLRDCTAVALTNSGRFIQPVSSIDGRELTVGGAMFDELWQVLAEQPGVARV